jgi:hypothetical protein
MLRILRRLESDNGKKYIYIYNIISEYKLKIDMDSAQKSLRLNITFNNNLTMI